MVEPTLPGDESRGGLEATLGPTPAGPQTTLPGDPDASQTRGEPSGAETVFGSASGPSPPPSPNALPAIPGYLVEAEVGRGGMGVVYRARQRVLNRTVALKMILAGDHAGVDAGVRFLAEAEAVARLQHPNVVQIYHIAEHQGRPYFEMEYLGGGSLADRLDGQPRPPRDAARLVATIAGAVAEAHRSGIVHRDLKPGNVLLAPDGTPKVADFGLAKSIGVDSGLTRTDSILGSPSYMAPEQAGGFARDVGPAADVYALGAILYEQLTGRPPLVGATVLETLRQVKEVDPVPPGRLVPGLPRDLETIALACLDKSPAGRYQTAGELAADLGRFLGGEPIRARPVPPWERAWKWARRRPAVAGLIGLTLASMLAGTAISAAFGLRANDRAAAARQAEARARSSEGDAQAARRLAVAERDGSRRLSAGLALDRGLALAEEGQVGRGLLWMLEALATSPAEEADFRLMARRNLAGWLGVAHVPRKIILPGTPKSAWFGVTFSPDGRTFVTYGDDPGDSETPAVLRDSETGRALASYPGAAFPVAFRPDGGLLAFRRPDGGMAAVDPASGRELWTVGRELWTTAPGFRPQAVSFLPDGARMIVSWQNKEGRWFGQVKEVPRGKAAGEPWRGGYAAVVGGKALITNGDERSRSVIWLLDPATGSRSEVLRLDGERTFETSVSPDGKTLRANTYDSQEFLPERTLSRTWDLATRRPVGPTLERVTRALPSPANDQILTLADGAITPRDPEDGRAVGPPLLREAKILDFKGGPDGRTLAIATRDGVVQLWGLAGEESTPAGVRGSSGDPAARDANRRRMARTAYPYPRLAPGGGVALRWAVGAGGRSLALLDDPADGRPVGLPSRHRFPTIRSFGFDPEGRRFATGSDAGWLLAEVRVWDAATGRPLAPPMIHSNYVSALAFQPGGRLLAAGDYHGLVRTWDAATGEEVGPPMPQGSIVFALAFSPDGKTLAVGHHVEQARKPGVRLWDVAGRRPIGELLGHPATVTALAFRPDGKVFAATDEAGTRLWEVSGSPVGDRYPGESLAAFRPDGRELASAGSDGLIRFRDASTGALLAEFAGETSGARRVAYRPDGRMVVAGFADGSVRLIDRATVRQVGPSRTLRGPVSDVAFVGDGTGFAAVDVLGESRTWPVPEPSPSEDPAELAPMIEARTGFRMAEGPAVASLDQAAWSERIDRLARPVGTPGPADDAAWHGRMARRAEGAGNDFAAAWHLDRMIADRPGDWALHARRARVRSSAGDFEGAAADYGRVAQLGPREALLDWEARAAVEALEAGRDAESLWYLDRLVAARPGDWALLDDRSAVHARLGHRAEAEADHARALALGGDAALALPEAERLARAGRWDAAARLLAECARRNPLDPALAQAWSVSCLRADDRESYREARSTLIARSAGLPKFPLFLLELASVLALGPGDEEMTGELIRWFEARRSTLAPSPGSFYHAISNALGGLYLRAGRPDQAITRLQEGTVGEEAYATDLAYLAIAQVGRGDPASARLALDRLRGRDPSGGPSGFWDVEELALLRLEAEARLLDQSFPADPFESSRRE